MQIIRTHEQFARWVHSSDPGAKIIYMPEMKDDARALSDAGRVFLYQETLHHTVAPIYHAMRLSPEGARFVNWVSGFTPAPPNSYVKDADLAT